MDLLAFTAWQMLIGSLLLALLGLLMPAPPIQWTGYYIGAALYDVIACNALAWLLRLYALQTGVMCRRACVFAGERIFFTEEQCSALQVRGPSL